MQEKRFVSNKKVTEWLGKNSDKWKSIVLTKAEHLKFTQAWRKAIGYKEQAAGTSGFNTSNITLNELKIQARKIYKDYPEILKALGL